MLPSLYYDNRWKAVDYDEKSLELAKELGLSYFLTAHLGRFYKNEKEIKEFLWPKPSQNQIPGTEEIAKRIKVALDQKKRILFFGDYDVDGLSSLALMVLFLRENGFDPLHYVPSRYDEGYGLTLKAIEKLPEVDLLVSFDCGITAVEEVEVLKNRGVEVLITDHHQPGESLPDCLIMNPQLGEEFKELAGVGVAYKLATYLSQTYGYALPKDSIVFAMLGTVCDLMPLIKENRLLVKEGLKAYEKTSHPGLLALRKVAPGALDAQHIGFGIGPMINAAGRLGEAEEALKLLLAEGDSFDLALRLRDYNNQRKEEEKQVVKEALKKTDQNQPLLIVSGDWKQGLLGLAASRISQRYRKPAIVLDKNLKGSSRSVGNFSIIHALDYSAKYLDHYGGHKMAAGLAISEGKYEEFKEKVFSYTRENFDFLQTRKCYDYLCVEPGDINLELLDKLNFLSPYGIKNPQLVFQLKNLSFVECIELGKSGRAFTVIFKAKDRRFEFICFDPQLISLLEKEKYDLIFTASEDVFRGILSLKLQLRDLRPSKPSLEKSRLFLPFYEGLAKSIERYKAKKQEFSFPKFEEDRIYKLGDPEFPESFPHPKSFTGEESSLLEDLPSREDLVKIYSWLRRQGKSFSWQQPKRPLLAMISLIIFEELNLLTYTNINGICYYEVISTMKKNNLESSPTYCRIIEIREDM